MKVTNFDKDVSGLMTAKDKTTIKQIRDKLQSLDASGGEKSFHQFLEMGLNPKRTDSKLKNPTLNYVLNGSGAKHLQLGPNGELISSCG